MRKVENGRRRRGEGKERGETWREFWGGVKKSAGVSWNDPIIRMLCCGCCSCLLGLVSHSA